MTAKIPTKPMPMKLNGKDVHPLVYAAAHHTYIELGKALGHSNHSTVAIYTMRAKKKPSTRIPAEWVLSLARLLKLRPYDLRPDLYLKSWTLA